MMTEATKYLNEETANSLSSFQINKLNREINAFKLLNAETKTPAAWKVCPKCSKEVAHFRSGGFTYDKNGNAKKHMLKCPFCKSRFVEDYGSLTFYSHSDASVWAKVIEDTFDGISFGENSCRSRPAYSNRISYAA